MNFDAAVKYLLSLGHETLAIKLGLKNTELLLHALDNPQRSFVSVQIAGTNGKGSTAAMLESICREAGIESGLFTSPHLVSITERIKLSGVEITPEAFAGCVTTVRAVALQLLQDKVIEALPTFFEQLTAAALVAFRDAGIELAILETGLGGRLDSTTTANASVVAITPIAMDHEEYLGHSLESIAAEKAAIIRPGVKAVIAKQQAEAMAVLWQRCKEAGVIPRMNGTVERIDEVSNDGRFCVTLDTGVDRYERLWLALRGQHQIENALTAIRLAELLRGEGFAINRSAIVSGIATAMHPGRLEFILGEPAFLIDGAHNPAGAESLSDYLEEFGKRPLTMIFGAMRDKQLERIGEQLFTRADTLILTMIDNPRSATIEQLKPIATRFAPGRIATSESSAGALQIALDETEPQGLICIAGSLYLVGELRPRILELSSGLNA